MIKCRTSTGEAAARQNQLDETENQRSNKNDPPKRFGEPVKHLVKAIEEQSDDGNKVSDDLRRVSLEAYGYRFGNKNFAKYAIEHSLRGQTVHWIGAQFYVCIFLDSLVNPLNMFQNVSGFHKQSFSGFRIHIPVT